MLTEILKQFEQKRKELIRDGQWGKNAVADCFEPCAKEILCNGFFLVNNKYIIDLGAIELYYHEEEGDIKDYIMYHTNAHSSKSKLFELNRGFPYFKFGSFNLHQSGVDVTFENPKEKYRASFLIRSYRVIREENELNDFTIPFDKCSTHIFDDMFFNGIMFDKQNELSMEWVKCQKQGDIEKVPRKNVTKREIKYEDDKKRYVIVKSDEPDLRPWQFKRKYIIEK